jgi:hypothetical protein
MDDFLHLLILAANECAYFLAPGASLFFAQPFLRRMVWSVGAGMSMIKALHPLSRTKSGTRCAGHQHFAGLQAFLNNLRGLGNNIIRLRKCSWGSIKYLAVGLNMALFFGM